MVFFTCNACGTSLKKAQVEKHRFQCRNPSTTYCCVDCLKDFSGEDYKDHTKCITEEQKYSGVGWKPPAGFQKGEKKQQAWVETVQNVLSDPKSKLDPMSRKLLQCISRHDNIPRKKPKFMNFIRNITKNSFDNATIDRVWILLEAQWKPAPKNEPDESKQLQEEAKNIEEAVNNGKEENTIEEESSDKKRKSKKKKKKVKDEDDEKEQTIETENAIVDDNLIEEENSDKKRKSKKKKRKLQDEDGEEVEKNEVENIIFDENWIEEENSETKRKSKKKKRKLRDEDGDKGENIEVENTIAEENVVEEDNSAKKRKSKKKKLH